MSRTRVDVLTRRCGCVYATVPRTSTARKAMMKRLSSFLVGTGISLVVVTANQSASAPQRLDVGGPAFVYAVTGSGPPVVLLHGAFMDRTTWDAQVPAFAKQFRVVRYDIRPFGESSRPDKPYSVTNALLRLLDHLKIERAHLVGHSFG